MPIREIKIPAKQYVCEPWITKGLKKYGNKQLKLYKKCLKSGNEDDVTLYKNYKSTLQRIKRSKLQYYSDKCNQFKNDTKKLWKTINNAIKSNHDKSNLIDSIKVDNIEITDTQQIAEEFGKFFMSIGYNTSIKGGNSTKNITHYLEKIPVDNSSVFLTPCLVNEISRLIENLPNKTSSGYDNITNVIIKKLGTSLSTPLSIIFNLLLNQGVFPTLMKVADVVPLSKVEINLS